MDTQEIKSLMADAVQIGYMQAVKSYEPASDAIRSTEVKQWLKHMLVSWAQFVKLERAGLIKPYRKGKAANSPLFYSKSEIKQALTTAKLAALTR
jgi:hypothetical protein